MSNYRRSVIEPLNENEVSDLRYYLTTENNIDEEYISKVDEVYSQIEDGIYDIISLLDEDKKISNWIQYGYEVEFTKTIE